jgi:hypothetical protein
MAEVVEVEAEGHVVSTAKLPRMVITQEVSDCRDEHDRPRVAAEDKMAENNNKRWAKAGRIAAIEAAARIRRR